MDEKIRREEMSDIDAMNAMEEIDRISTGEGADELNGVWSSAGPRGISDGVMNSMEQIPPDEFEQGQPAEPMRERRGAGGGIWRAVGRIGVPVLLAVALAATAVWGDGQRALAEGYKQSSENMYRRAFTELCDDMSNMQTALGKLRVAGSGGQYMLLLDDIWRLSGSCVSLMSQIPSSHIDTAELNSFVVRIGDYARALSKKALNDEERTAERMKQAALEWLGKAGFDDMHATYAQYYSGAGVINFAATKDDIILYNDLVKVWVDIETNEVIGADARNYLFSHTEREMPTPSVSPEEAEAKVSVNLEIESRELALIPITVETERLCYEFKGRCGEDEYIVYIDAQTGAEQQIFVIINTENGQLTA